MKCKECNTVNCPFRTTDAEKECQFQSSVIQVPDEWQGVRIQAAIAAMQGFISNRIYINYKATKAKENSDNPDLTFAVELCKDAVQMANALIEELKKK